MSIDVFISEEAYKQIQNEVRRHPGLETGGVIVGFSTPTSIVVTSVSGPGPKAVHEPNSISFDDQYCSKKVKQLVKRKPFLRYLGDWHTHPFTRLQPSPTDMRTVSLKSKTHYQTLSPLMIISGPVPLVPLQAFILKGRFMQTTPKLIDRPTLRDLTTKAISK